MVLLKYSYRTTAVLGHSKSICLTEKLCISLLYLCGCSNNFIMQAIDNDDDDDDDDDDIVAGVDGA